MALNIDVASGGVKGVAIDIFEGFPESLRLRVSNIGAGGELGVRIVELIRTPQMIGAMVDAAAKGWAPAAVVSRKLVDEIGLDALSGAGTRNFVGYVVSWLLAQEGFRVRRSGVRLTADPLFQTASTFEPVPKAEQAPAQDILTRFLEALSQEELDQVRRFVDQKTVRKRRGKD